MFFWLGILAAVVLAYVATRIGFYESLTWSFNLWVAIYLGVFLAPAVMDWVPAAEEIPCATAAMTLVLTSATLAILGTLAYLFVTGQFSVPFPKILDFCGAGGLGFLSGFAVLSFALLLVQLTPAADLSDSIGDSKANLSFVCWYCDRLHAFVGTDQLGQARKAVDRLLEKAKESEARPAGEADPNSPALPAPKENAG